MNMIAAEKSIADLSPQQILKVLSRNTENADSPEARLWLGVIGQAVVDGKKHGGYRWFKEGGHKDICDLIGLNADMTAEICIAWMDSK